MAAIRALALLVALGTPVASARAQSVMVGGAVHDDLQRFEGEAALNRLDGDSIGWMIFGGARFGHFVARGETSRDSTIRNTQSITLTIRGNPATIQSELSHDMQESAALGGYAVDIAGRFEPVNPDSSVPFFPRTNKASRRRWLEISGRKLCLFQ